MDIYYLYALILSFEDADFFRFTLCKKHFEVRNGGKDGFNMFVKARKVNFELSKIGSDMVFIGKNWIFEL